MGMQKAADSRMWSAIRQWGPHSVWAVSSTRPYLTLPAVREAPVARATLVALPAKGIVVAVALPGFLHHETHSIKTCFYFEQRSRRLPTGQSCEKSNVDVLMCRCSFGTLIGWKSGQTTYFPLWDRIEGAWLCGL
jgi:hypothetical protein